MPPLLYVLVQLCCAFLGTLLGVLLSLCLVALWFLLKLRSFGTVLTVNEYEEVKRCVLSPGEESKSNSKSKSNVKSNSHVKVNYERQSDWLERPPTTLRAAEDILNVAEQLRGKLTVQLGGKKRYRMRCSASLRGSWLCCWPSDKQRKGVEIYDLRRCRLRQTLVGKFALELDSAWRAFRPSVYYLYLLFDDAAQYHVWYNELSRIAELSSTGFHEKVASGIKSARAAVGSGDDNNNGAGGDGEATAVANDQLVDSVLRAVCLDDHATAGVTASTAWLNVLLSRFFASMHCGTELVERIQQKLVQKITDKLIEKGLDHRLQNIAIGKVTMGDEPPRFGNAAIMAPDAAGGVCIDLDIEYAGALVIQLSAVLVTPIRTGVQGSICLKRLKGRVCIHVDPVGRLYTFSFYEFPHAEWDVQLDVGRVTKLFDLSTLLIKRVKTSLSERFVMPNRKHGRMPKTPKSYWEQPEVVMRHVGRVQIATMPLVESASEPAIAKSLLDGDDDGDLTDARASAPARVMTRRSRSRSPAARHAAAAASTSSSLTASPSSSRRHHRHRRTQSPSSSQPLTPKRQLNSSEALAVHSDDGGEDTSEATNGKHHRVKRALSSLRRRRRSWRDSDELLTASDATQAPDKSATVDE
jgi:hypothetical protein